MVTTMGWTTGAEMVKESVADFEVSATEVAVMVGALSGEAGAVLGGV
jgi:hypothetical protein